MTKMENTDYVHETYLNMNKEEVQEGLKEDRFYNYFYNLLETGSNYCKFSNLILGVGRTVAARMRGGKSGLHRAKRWITPRGSDPWKVSQKINRHVFMVRVKR